MRPPPSKIRAFRSCSPIGRAPDIEQIVDDDDDDDADVDVDDDNDNDDVDDDDDDDVDDDDDDDDDATVGEPTKRLGAADK